MTKISNDWIFTEGALRVLSMLNDAGHDAYIVGGAVRNALMGAGPTDIDIATDAHPERVTELADALQLRVIPTGIEHGTVTILVGDDAFEVTTYRKDIETDGRRAVVEFGTSIEEDAARRDFTMNALYADRDGNVIDPVGGLTDAKERRIRFIGNPAERIAEDYLRIMRFFRLYAQYGDPALGIDADGLAACAGAVDGLESLSKERIGQEIHKLLSALDPAPAVATFAASGGLQRILPGADAAQLAVLVHNENEAKLAPDPIRRLAALGGENTADLLRLSKKEANRLRLLRENIGNGKGAAELAYRLGLVGAVDVLVLRSTLFGGPFDPGSVEVAQSAVGQKFPISAADLLADFQGPQLGAELKALENKWIKSGFTLSREALLG